MCQPPRSKMFAEITGKEADEIMELKHVLSPVEFVIAKSHGIVVQVIHDFDYRLSVEEIGYRGPLEHITG